MKHYLYKFAYDSYEGFAILTETQKDIGLAKIKKQYKRGGRVELTSSDDSIEYDDLDDVLDTIDFALISSEEHEVLKKLFPERHLGETGPLDLECLDFEDDEEEEECENCGRPLDDSEDSLCSECEEKDDDKYEEEYNSQADEVYNFIKKEYGVEPSNTYDYHSKFSWKPTPKTNIEITIGEYGYGEEEVELTLFLNGANLEYEFFKVEDIYSDPGASLRDVIKRFIEKAKKY